MTADLVEFLRAREDEREEAARAEGHYNPDDSGYYACPAMHAEPYGDLPWGEDACDCGLAARRAAVLAEVEAKRRIIEEHGNVNDGDCGTCVHGKWGYPTHGGAVPQRWPCRTLRFLGSVHAEHPDYRDEWKP